MIGTPYFRGAVIQDDDLAKQILSLHALLERSQLEHLLNPILRQSRKPIFATDSPEYSRLPTEPFLEFV